jgi:uncharacterized membrane protein
MNGAHLHLILNHVPVIGLGLSMVVLATGMLRRSDEIVRAGALLLVLIALITIPVYLTGEPAEDVLHDMAAVNDDLIHAHEDVAVWAMILIEVLGAGALVGLAFFRREDALPGWFAPSLLALALVSMALVGWTSYLGGEIMHPEARPGFDVQASDHAEEGAEEEH